MLHRQRDNYDAFLVVHGTDTLSYTASALSLMLCGFRKPIVMTGSQLPLALPRSDARQNLIDALTCATAGSSPPHVHLQVRPPACWARRGCAPRGSQGTPLTQAAHVPSAGGDGVLWRETDAWEPQPKGELLRVQRL